MSMKRSRKRDLGRERRRRIDALHRTWERGDHEKFTEKNIHPTVPKNAAPLSLDKQLHREVRRFRRVVNPGIQYLMGRAKDYALGVQHLDQSPRILAAFGIERAVDEVARYALDDLTGPVPDCFVEGTGYAHEYNLYKNVSEFHQVEGTTLTPEDIAAIRCLQTDDGDNIPARWAPRQPFRVFSTDVVRPPVETVVLAARVVEAKPTSRSMRLYDPSTLPPVLVLGAGHMAAAQALSVRLPAYRIYHWPVPVSRPHPPKRPWEAVILNIPSQQAWTTANMINNWCQTTFLERRSVLRGNGSDSQYVHYLLDIALQHRVAGKPLILLADQKPHYAATGRLRSTGVAEPIDATRRGIWVGYEQTPWAPHGVPAPTGRVVTSWRWR